MKTHPGFTVVELLVTLVVGLLLIVSMHQFYNYILTDSADARTRAVASNLAYQYLRQYSAQAADPCTSSTIAPAVPADAALPDPVSASVSIACAPNIPTNRVSRITATVTYGSPSTTVTHATYVRAK